MPACQCKKDSVTPPAPPDPVKDIYLVTSIRINGVPKDSFVYNDRYQVKERWDYNPSYRIWQNYISFSYNADGYLKKASYYNENDNTLKSLSQQDSIVWTPGRLKIYNTFYRELGEVISGYDSAFMQLLPDNKLALTGSKDTVHMSGTIRGERVYFQEYQYNNNEISRFIAVDYFNHFDSPPVIKEVYDFEMQYNQQNNPLYQQVAKNPILLRAITSDLLHANENGYPFLASEHYVTAIKYQHNSLPAINVTVSYQPFDTSGYPVTQSLPGLNTTVTYNYKIIKVP